MPDMAALKISLDKSGGKLLSNELAGWLKDAIRRGEFCPGSVLPGSCALADAEAKVKELVDGIERGVFWTAADTSEWRWDFADWIFNSPEESVDPAWIEDQMRRIEGPTLGALDSTSRREGKA